MYNINQIESTLKYGKIHTNRKLKFFKILLIVSFIITIICFLIGAISVFLDVLNFDEIISFIGTIIFSTFILLSLLYVYIKNKKRNLEINKWLEDSVRCEAFVKRLDIENLKYQSYQIEISFTYKNKKIKKVSGKFNIIKDGLPKIFAKYHNKTLEILYSEKFDEILILKEKISN